jgi:hypothetical protein
MLKLTALMRGLAPAAARLRGGHRQRFLADDVLAGGEDRRCLGDVEVVRRGDVNDVDRRVGEDVVQGPVGVTDTQRVGPRRAALRRAAEDAAHVNTDPAELLDVDGPDEAGPDDGGTDVGEPAHPAPDGARIRDGIHGWLSRRSRSFGDGSDGVQWRSRAVWSGLRVSAAHRFEL